MNWIRHYLRARSLLLAWGERATPCNLAFVWSYTADPICDVTSPFTRRHA